jgi:hypothetical protein
MRIKISAESCSQNMSRLRRILAMNISKARWGELYEMADEILELAPWKTYFEIDLFAIQPRAGGTVYFVSVMGSQGEHHALAFYPGLESLSQFRMSQMDDIPERIGVETMMLNQHLEVTFEPKRYLIPPDLDVLKSLGKIYRGKWPAFRSHRPARMPWSPSASEIQDFAVLLEQSLVVLKRLNAGEDLLRPFEEEEFFLRRNDGQWGDSICRIEDLPTVQHILQADLPEGVLDGLRRTKERVEVDLVLMLTPMTDVPPGEAPYLPLMLLMVNSSSGLVMGFETLSTKEGLDAAMVRIPDAITGLLKKAKIIPGKIAARNPILISALASYCDAYGMDYEIDAELAMASEAIESLTSFLQK